MAGAPFISMTIKLAPLAHKRLFEDAKPRGYTPTAFAQLLFDAAFAARMRQVKERPADDAELDEMVRATLCLAGDFSTAAIARRLGLSEQLVERILDGWRQQKAPQPKARRA
jgi:hypothetical protein